MTESSNSQWYVRYGDGERGPLTWEELCAAAAEGRLPKVTPVRQGQTGVWVAAGSVPGLPGSTKPFSSAAGESMDDDLILPPHAAADEMDADDSDDSTYAVAHDPPSFRSKSSVNAPPPPDPGGYTYAVQAESPPPLPNVCPMCRVPMAPQSVLCVACGYHRGLGRHVGDAAKEAGGDQPDRGGSSDAPFASSAAREVRAAPAAESAAAALQTVRWCASCGGEIPPGVAHCRRCNLTVNQKTGEGEPSLAATYVADLVLPGCAILATLIIAPSFVAWAEQLGGPLLARFVLMTLIHASIGAATVRVACWLLGEAAPAWPHATAIGFLAGIASGGAYLALAFLPKQGFGAAIGTLILMFVAPGAVFYAMLDVEFWKGVLIYVIYFFILVVLLLASAFLLGVAVVL